MIKASAGGGDGVGGAMSDLLNDPGRDQPRGVVADKRPAVASKVFGRGMWRQRQKAGGQRAGRRRGRGEGGRQRQGQEGRRKRRRGGEQAPGGRERRCWICWEIGRADSRGRGRGGGAEASRAGEQAWQGTNGSRAGEQAWQGTNGSKGREGQHGRQEQ